MPFEVIDALDPYTAMVEFKTSAVYEMVISIASIFKPMHGQEAWSHKANAEVAPDLLKELTYIYQEFEEGRLYFELPVDYPDHSNVPGFFDYVRGLSDLDFVFYLVGRILPRKDLARLMAKPAALKAAITRTEDRYDWYGRKLDPILADIPAFRNRLVDVWQAYWETYFQHEILALQPIWAIGLEDKKNILSREGGRGVLERIRGKADLPPELPPGVPFTSITLIPVCLLPSRAFQFFGYGNITILFDPQYTEERRIALQAAKDEAVSTLKALDDETRLKILHLITRHGSSLHGKSIAERLGISASAVSRHLALLKDGKLILEEPQKNLITYRFQKETLEGLVDKLLDYLYS